MFRHRERFPLPCPWPRELCSGRRLHGRRAPGGGTRGAPRGASPPGTAPGAQRESGAAGAQRPRRGRSGGAAGLQQSGPPPPTPRTEPDFKLPQALRGTGVMDITQKEVGPPGVPGRGRARGAGAGSAGAGFGSRPRSGVHPAGPRARATARALAAEGGPVWRVASSQAREGKGGGGGERKERVSEG